MPSTVDELVAQAEALSESDRLLLVERLRSTLSGFDADVDAAWTEEVERRLEAIERGAAKTIPWEQAKKTLGL